MHGTHTIGPEEAEPLVRAHLEEVLAVNGRTAAVTFDEESAEAGAAVSRPPRLREPGPTSRRVSG